MWKKLTLLLLLTVQLFSSIIDDFINKQNCDQIIDKQVFTICYSYKYKGALFVAYELDGNLVNKKNIKKRPRFYSEKNIPIKYRSKSKDYTKSGYDRGHLANDGSFDYDIKALRKTYSMANIIPQAPKVNRYTWIKAERYERLIATKLGKVTVINGVIYSKHPKRIGKNKVAVPIGYWKMLINTKEHYKKCFYYKNFIDTNTKQDKLNQHLIDCSTLH